MDTERLKKFKLDFLLPDESDDPITAGYKALIVQRFEKLFESQDLVATIGSFIEAIRIDLSEVGIQGIAAWEWKARVIHSGDLQKEYALMASAVESNKQTKALGTTIRQIDEDRKAAEAAAAAEAQMRLVREEELAHQERARQGAINRLSVVIGLLGLSGLLFDFMSWGNGKTQADIAVEERQVPGMTQKLKASDEAWNAVKANLDRTNERLRKLEVESAAMKRGIERQTKR